MKGRKREGLEWMEGWRAEVEKDLSCIFRLREDLKRSRRLKKGFEALSDAVVRDRPSPTGSLWVTAAGFESYAGLSLVSTRRNNSWSGKALDRYILMRLVLRVTTAPILSSLRRMVSH